MEFDELQDKCGIIACVAAKQWSNELEVSNIISMGLLGLQHRGQESAGIVTSNGKGPFLYHRDLGLVSQVFTPDTLERLKCFAGIGHTRYNTIGLSDRTNCQPFVVESTYGQFAVAHNGELVNSKSLKKRILQRGIGLSSGTDSETMTQLLCETPQCGEPYGVNWVGRIKRMMEQTKLSYSLAILSKDKVYVARDPYGNRPLCLGYLHDQGLKSNLSLTELERNATGYIASSESCVFSSVGATFVREVLPGEIVKIDNSGFKSVGMVPCEGGKAALCIFEYIYFCRPDSYLEGQQVNGVRFRCGAQLARESKVDADLVSGVPESATAAALGYAKESGIPYCEVLTRNRYVGRTFIQPTKHLRQLGVIKKFGFLKENFVGKRVVLIDDSIVRGNTIAPLVSVLKRFGASEVHLRVASPPIRHPCFMGINIPTESELIYNSVSSPAQLAAKLGADSLQYLSVEGLHTAVASGIKPPREPASQPSGDSSDLIGGLDGITFTVQSSEATFQEVHQSDAKAEVADPPLDRQSSACNTGHCNACLTGNYPVAPEF